MQENGTSTWYHTHQGLSLLKLSFLSMRLLCRARGTELISPDDLVQAIKTFDSVSMHPKSFILSLGFKFVPETLPPFSLYLDP